MDAETFMNRERLQRINVVPADDPLPDYPCGFLRCTYEEFPKVIHANQHMFNMLNMTADSEDWRGFIRNNIFFLIPSDERNIMRRYLNSAAESQKAVSIEHSVHTGTGRHVKLMGWVRVAVNRDGTKEYHFLYVEFPSSAFSLQKKRELAYEQVLKSIYTLIVKINFSEGTIECIHKADAERYPYMLGAKISLSAIDTDTFFGNAREQDRDRLENFFRQLVNPAQQESENMNISFSIENGGEYFFAAARLDEKVTLLCGRNDAVSTYVPLHSDTPIHISLSPEPYSPPEAEKKPRVTIHTFGYFDVFVDGKPVVFRYEKSKEMLAILVDRKGSFVANPYLISCLWEDEPYNEKIQSRCRQTAYRMMETLKQYGIEDIVEKVSGRRRIIPEMVDCDCFNYIQGKNVSGQTFNGAYMSDYSWGETTLSALTQSNNTIE